MAERASTRDGGASHRCEGMLVCVQACARRMSRAMSGIGCACWQSNGCSCSKRLVSRRDHTFSFGAETSGTCCAKCVLRLRMGGVQHIVVFPTCDHPRFDAPHPISRFSLNEGCLFSGSRSA